MSHKHNSARQRRKRQKASNRRKNAIARQVRDVIYKLYVPSELELFEIAGEMMDSFELCNSLVQSTGRGMRSA